MNPGPCSRVLGANNSAAILQPVKGSQMDIVQELITVSANIILLLSALHATRHLFKDHRAASVGFFLIACSSALAVLPVPCPALLLVQKELEWAGEALGPALSAFAFLYLSEDHLTAHVLLVGSTLLSALADWLTDNGLVIMTRCLSLSALSCSLTVCLFAANGTGMLGSVALSLPAFVAPRIRGGNMASLVSSQATRGLMECTLKAVMALGCWTTKRALDKFLLDLKCWD